MNETRRNFMVGLFALGGVAVLAALIMLFGQAGFLSAATEAYRVNILFERAPGIREGTIVTVSGIPVGRVRSVRFADDAELAAGVLVETQLEPGYQLREGTTARASEPGLGMGRPPISLSPGPASAATLPSGATISGKIGSPVESLIPQDIVLDLRKTAVQLGNAADALQPVLADLHELLQPRRAAEVDRVEGLTGNLATAIERLDAGLKNVNDVLSAPDIKEKLIASVDNVYTITEDGKTLFANMTETSQRLDAATADAQKLIQQTTKSVENIDQSVDQVSRDLIRTIDSAARAMREIEQLTSGINDGKGTLGLLASDPRLYESLVLSVREAQTTIEEFKLLLQQWQEGKIKVGL